jgi:hypothetical protein
LADRVRFGDEVGPLMVEIHRYVASLVRCFTGDAKELTIPVASEGEAPANFPATSPDKTTKMVRSSSPLTGRR